MGNSSYKWRMFNCHVFFLYPREYIQDKFLQQLVNFTTCNYETLQIKGLQSVTVG